MSRHVLPDHNAGHGLHLPANPRTLVIIAAAGGLVLMLILRRGNAAAAPATAADPAAIQTGDPSTAGVPSTFADNGGQAAQLGNDVTGALGGVSTSFDNFGTQVSGAIGGLQTEIDTLNTNVIGLQQNDAGAKTAAPSFAQETTDVIGAYAAISSAVKAAGAPAGKAKPKPAPAKKPAKKPAAKKPVKRGAIVAVKTPVHKTSPAKKTKH